MGIFTTLALIAGPPILSHFLSRGDAEAQEEALDAGKLLALTQADALNRRLEMEEPFRASIFDAIAELNSQERMNVAPGRVAVTNPFLNLQRASIDPGGQVQTTAALPGAEQQFIGPENISFQGFTPEADLAGGLLAALNPRTPPPQQKVGGGDEVERLNETPGIFGQRGQNLADAEAKQSDTTTVGKFGKEQELRETETAVNKAGQEVDLGPDDPNAPGRFGRRGRNG